MNWESGIETYTLPYVKQTARGNLQYDTGSSNPLLCDNLGVEWGGSAWEVQEGGDMNIPMANFCFCMAETNTMYCKAIIPQLKNK